MLFRSRHVHELGMGTSAFVTDRLPVDPRTWERTDMDDIVMAIEAQRRGLPRVVIPRREGWLTPLLRAGADSLWARTLRDDTEQTRRMRELLALYSI